jgi:Fibronectin type III domain
MVRTTPVVGMVLLGLVAVAGIFMRAAQPVQAASPPGAPGMQAAIAGEASATVYWSAASGTVTSYQVAASPGGANTTVGGSTLSATVTGLSDATSYTFTVTAINASSPGPASSASNAVVPGKGAFQPLTPARILDTRSGSPLGPGGTRTLAVDGMGGLPASGMSAVWLNVTVTGTTAMSFLTVWPADVPRPTASNLNWTAGTTVPNLVVVALGPGDRVSFYNAAGTADVVVDVEGYGKIPTGSASPDFFNPVVPARVLDTRIGVGAPKAQLCAGQTITVQIAGQRGIPSSGVTAVVMNVTGTRTVVAPSFVTVWPADKTRPTSSNLNFVPGQTVANRVVVPLSAGGAVSFYDFVGHLDVVADVNGWFTNAPGSAFVAMAPNRLLDTRQNHVIWSANTMKLLVTGIGTNTQGAVAVVLNVTVTNTSNASWMTAWPDGAPRPATSDLNWTAGQTVPNLVVVQIGPAGPDAGAVDFYNAFGQADLIVDLVGWYG